MGIDRNLAPIVLFVYNRPYHTQQTLEALANNTFADESILYIYVDGPKIDASEETIQKIAETKRVVSQKNWCKEVHIIESKHNKGLADSITEGITSVINKHGRVIVLEDDIVTSPSFLKYMNDALDLYESSEKVMHISGFMPVTTGAEKLPETFFLRFMSCWGWATWKESWERLITDTNYLYEKIPTLEDFNRFNLDNSIDMFYQLEENKKGNMKTWAIKWYSTIFLNKGLCLFPKYSLSKNIGFDGTGENCREESELIRQSNELILCESISVSPIKVTENKLGYNYLKRYYKYGENSSLRIKILALINKTTYLKYLYKIYHKIKNQR